MNIVQIVNSLSSGGAEVFACQLAVQLKRKGNKVYLITYAGIRDSKGEELHEYLINNHIKVIHFKRKNNYFQKIISPIFKIKKELKIINPEIVHAHLQLSDIYVAIINLLSFNKYKIYRTVHNPRRTYKLPQFFDRLLYKYFDFNIACSDFVKQNYVDRNLRKSLISIPNGIDITNIDKVEKSKNELRNSLGINKDTVVFMHIGSMNLHPPKNIPLKNQSFIIDAISDLANHDNLLVIFLGDGSLRLELEKQSVIKGVEHICRFEGNVTSVYEYLIASDFYLMPSLDEGLPISLIEAVCAGLYSVTSNIDAFIPFESMSVKRLNTFEVSEFTETLEELIYNRNHYLQLGDENREYFRSRFHIELVAKKYMKLYANSLYNERKNITKTTESI